MRTIPIVRLAEASLIAATFVATACDKKVTTASAESALSPIDYVKKPPGKDGRPIIQRAVRGGSGATTPNASSLRTPEPSTDRQMRKPAPVDLADCTKLPDNAAECEGKSMYFCDDATLWVVDCDAEAKFSGVSGGSCFEGEHFVDCLGCATADDGTRACCDFELTVCCNDVGECWNPK